MRELQKPVRIMKYSMPAPMDALKSATLAYQRPCCMIAQSRSPSSSFRCDFSHQAPAQGASTGLPCGVCVNVSGYLPGYYLDKRRISQHYYPSIIRISVAECSRKKFPCRLLGRCSASFSQVLVSFQVHCKIIFSFKIIIPATCTEQNLMYSSPKYHYRKS